MTKRPRTTPYTICPGCGKAVRVRPAGGDWLNALYMVRHQSAPGVQCEKVYREVKTADLIEPGFD